MVPPFLAYSMLKKVLSPRPYTCFKVYVSFSMHMLIRKDQWVMMAKPPSRKVSVCRLVFFTRKVFTSCWADGFQICWS